LKKTTKKAPPQYHHVFFREIVEKIANFAPN
jgi:hypothetical protein